MLDHTALPAVGIGSTPQDLAKIYVSAIHAIPKMPHDVTWTRPYEDYDQGVAQRIEFLAQATLNEYRNQCGPNAAELLWAHAEDHKGDARTVFNLAPAQWDWYCELIIETAHENWLELVRTDWDTFVAPANLSALVAS